MIDFFEQIKVTSFNKEASIKCSFIIVVFCPYIEIAFKSEKEMFEFDDTHYFENLPTLDWVKDQIETKDYPITIIELSDYDDSENQCIEFITNFIKTSKHKALRLSFQNILN